MLKAGFKNSDYRKGIPEDTTYVQNIDPYLKTEHFIEDKYTYTCQQMTMLGVDSIKYRETLLALYCQSILDSTPGVLND